MLGDLHLCACVKCAGNDECPCDTVDGIGKCARIMVIFEPDGTRSNAACADADGQDKESEQRQHFDTVDGISESTRTQHRGTYSDNQNSISPYARTPRLDSPRNRNQKIKIHPHWGTASVQKPMTSEIALYSLARICRVSDLPAE